jgi:hypothetical protein
MIAKFRDSCALRDYEQPVNSARRNELEFAAQSEHEFCTASCN